MVGNRFDFQTYPQSLRGGLSYYPYSGVLSGLKVIAAAHGGTGSETNLKVTVSAGAVRLDGVKHELAANLADLIIPAGVNLATAPTATLDLWINPRRVMPALTSNPSSPSVGDKYIKVIDKGDYLQVDQILVFENNAWNPYDAVSKEPYAYSHNNLPLNKILPVIDTATTNNKSFSLFNEKVVFHKTNHPAYVCAPSAAYVRQPAGLRLATIKFTAGTAVVENYSDRSQILI